MGKRDSGSDVQAHLSAEVDEFKTFIKIKTGSITKKTVLLYSIGKRGEGNFFAIRPFILNFFNCLRTN